MSVRPEVEPLGGFREEIAEQLEQEIRPLIAKSRYAGGYDCCGCSTYDAILDHAIRIARGR